MHRRFALPLMVSGAIAVALSPLTRAGATDHTVEIKGLTFIPEEISVAAGDTVTWVNFDEDDHDLGGGVDSPVLKQGERFAFTFSRGGDIGYRCKIHTYMQGVVHVTGGDGTQGPPPSDGGIAPDPVPSTTTTANPYPPLGLVP